ncbi:MAG: SRPBCC family protein [Phycisphaerae bacterium]|nr:SRPBCC family protein [Phycisphaerae bacterium]
MSPRTTVKRVRNGFCLESELWLPRPRAEVFPFFANAFNLEMLTPPFLNFRVLTPGPIEMRAGARIDYRLRLHGLPLQWQSEITVWDPPRRFVDEQRRGPYRRWVHEHRFEDRQGGTQVFDSVHYDVYGGPLIERLLVRRDVQNIFAYRHRRLLEIFAPPSP